MMIGTRKRIGVVIGALGMCVCTLANVACVTAQTWPSRPVKMIMPSPPAGSPDRITRLVANRLTMIWGQPVLVENRPGATTMMGTEYFVKQAPDGYTLLSTFTSLVQAPALFDKVPYDWERDLVPVTQFTNSEVILLARSDSPWKTLQELIAAARAGGKAGQALSYGSFGNGSSFHIYGESFKRSAGIELVHVPYKGEAQSLTDLLGGQISVNFNSIGTALPHLRSGKVRALALVTSARSKAWPDVPTFSELGVARMDSSGWFGLFAPAGTPRPIVARIAADVAQVLAVPEIAANLREQGLDPVGSTPEVFAQFLRTNAAKWKQLAQETGIRADQ